MLANILAPYSVGAVLDGVTNIPFAVSRDLISPQALDRIMAYEVLGPAQDYDENLILSNRGAHYDAKRATARLTDEGLYIVHYGNRNSIWQHQFDERGGHIESRSGQRPDLGIYVLGIASLGHTLRQRANNPEITEAQMRYDDIHALYDCFRVLNAADAASALEHVTVFEHENHDLSLYDGQSLMNVNGNKAEWGQTREHSQLLAFLDGGNAVVIRPANPGYIGTAKLQQSP